MTSKNDRFFDPKDGTYANVPIIPVHPEIFRGKRPFDTNVLIGNWYEDRSKVSLFKSNNQLLFPRAFCYLQRLTATNLDVILSIFIVYLVRISIDNMFR